MAIIGIGTDIIEIARIETQLAKSERLAERVLTDFEMDQFRAHQFAARYLAKRFAAKEAAVKAMGTGIGNGVSWQHIEVRNLDSGQPVMTFNGYLFELAESRSVNGIWVSISDEKHYATATVVVES